MASKGNVVQTALSVLGVIGAFVATLLTTPLDGSVDTLAVRAIHAVPRFALGVAAGVATIFVAKLLTFVGREVWRWLRTITPTGSLRALASEIRELRRFENPTGPDALPLVSDYHLRCDELIAKLKKLRIPAPTREQFVILRSFLTVLYDCAIWGDVERAKGVLKELEPEVDVLRGAAKLKALAREIKELHDYKKDDLVALGRAEDLEVSHYLQRCDKLRDDLSKLDISLLPKMSDTPSLTRLLAYSLTRLLAYSLASLPAQAVWAGNSRGRGGGEERARTPGGR